MKRIALPPSVTLVAVTKTFPVDAIVEGYAAGIRHFGENYVEEFEEKYEQLPLDIKEHAVFHMIGHVQSRKAKRVAAVFDWVDSVDSMKLAKKLSEEASRQGQPLSILLEVNLTGEASKYGFDPVGFFQNVATISALPALQLCGLMIMPPLVSEPEKNRSVFHRARRLFEDVGCQYRHASWKHLSMGTSQDYRVAMEEGATMVRLGTVLFGERNKPIVQ